MFAVHHEDERAAQEAQAVGEHAGDRAGAVAELKGPAIARSRGGGDSKVATHRQSHADKADQPREGRPHEERAGASDGDCPGRLSREIHQAGQHEDEEDDRAELTAQIGIRSLPDRRADLAHLLRSLVGPIHLADKRHRHKPNPPPRSAARPRVQSARGNV